MSSARNPLQSILVIGDGQVGVLAAIALKRALPGARVTVIGMPRDPAAFADYAATALPFTNALHHRLGLSEELLLARAGGSHRLLTRYFGWGGHGQHGSLQYGEQADAAHSAGFGRDWGGGTRSGADMAGPPSLADTLASAGRFAPPSPDGNTALSGIDYALRWNVPAYHTLLAQAARSLGVIHHTAPGLQIEPDGAGGVASVAVTGVERIIADIYLDCSGTGALLARELPGYTTIDWAQTLATQRVLIGPTGGAMLALEDRISIGEAGWISEMAGRDGLQTMLGMSEFASESAVLSTLGGPPQVSIAVNPSRVAQCWQGNVIALGDAAARFEPLGGFNLDLAHRQIDLLLEMLPGMPFIDVERAEFNRRAGLMMDGVRDVLAMHYAAPAAAPRFASATPGPVIALIDQFIRRGRLPFREERPLLAQENIALLRALGFVAGTPPQLANRGPSEAGLAERAFIQRRDAVLAQMPQYQQWLASLLQSAG